MLTEEEKYYRFDQLLKGKLSVQDELELKEDYSLNAFTSTLESHRLANEAVQANHFLGLKAATKRIIKRKALNQKIKYVTGICIVTASMVAWYCYKPIKEKEIIKPITSQTKTFSTELNTIKLIEPAKPGAKTNNSIKPNKNNQTTNNISEASKLEEPTEQIPVKILETEDLKRVYSNVPSNQLVEKTNLNLGTTIAKTEKKSFQQEIKSHNEALEFILNPDRNEIVTFPVEEDFDGEIAIYNATGDLIFKQVVNHGKPNQWDGMMQTGGLAPSAQYGFVIKTKEGKEFKQGFVTVVR